MVVQVFVGEFLYKIVVYIYHNVSSTQVKFILLLVLLLSKNIKTLNLGEDVPNR